MKDIRHHQILEQVRASRAITVAELAAATHSSIATIRRDLRELDDEGLVRRTHGGAVVTELDSPFAEVEAVNAPAKELIARAAAETVVDGQSLLLDIGTTTARLALQLRNRPVTVITPSLAIYEILRDDPTAQLIMLPGQYDPVYRSVSGPLTTECLRLIRVDHTFLGVSGIADNGDLRDTTLAQVPVKRAMIEAGERTTVLADLTKMPGTGAGRLSPTGLIGTVLTDGEPPAATRRGLESCGVEVRLA